MNNAAELIRRDCTIIDFNNQRFEFDEIENRKNFLKNRIYSALNGQTVNKTIYVDLAEFNWVVPVMYLCMISITSLHAYLNFETFITLLTCPWCLMKILVNSLVPQ